MNRTIFCLLLLFGVQTFAEVYYFNADLSGEGISTCEKSSAKDIDEWTKTTIAEAKKDGADCSRAEGHDFLECDYKGRVVKPMAFKAKSDCQEMRGLVFAKLSMEKEKQSKNEPKQAEKMSDKKSENKSWDGPKITDTGKWNGHGSHPSKVLAYFNSSEMSSCKIIYYFYNPKGSLKHSPDVAFISLGYCIRDVITGRGINKKQGCEISSINWKTGRFTGYFDDVERLVNPGVCDKKNVLSFYKNIKQFRKAVSKHDVKMAVHKDELGITDELMEKTK